MKKLFFILIGLFLIVSFLFAAEAKKFDPNAYFAQIDSLMGNVMILKEGAEAGEWIPAVKGMQLSEGDTIKTGFGANAEGKVICAGAASIMKIKENTELKISSLSFDKRSGKAKTALDLAIGEVLIKAKRPVKPSSFEVKTPTSIVGVRGTVFSVNVIEI